jgi:PKD repeat protein
VSFDGSGSTDDGTITKYAWDFGDGTAAGSGVKVSHTYAQAGTYTAKLTVTDNGGLTGAVTHAVTVGGGGATALATDTFSRNLTGAWGSADVGGAWTVSSGTAPWTVSGGVGGVALKTAASGPTAYLNSLSQVNVNAVLDTSASAAATGNGVYTTLIARHSGTTDYRLKQVRLATGGIQLALSRVVGGAETTIKSLTLAGVTYTPGAVYRMRFVVTGTGTTTLSGSLWKLGSAEPASPQLTATDTTASLQGAGAFGIQSYIAANATGLPVTENYDNLSITAP